MTDTEAERLARYSPEAICEWLLARQEQRRSRLLAACASLRADIEAREAALQRLHAAVTRPAAPTAP